MKSLLTDVIALEQMIKTGRIETGIRRIGVEQEMFLVDLGMRPAPVAMTVLKNANDHRLTTEIGKFNLEANLSPRSLAGNGLREAEEMMDEDAKDSLTHAFAAESTMTREMIERYERLVEELEKAWSV